ncbi:AGE family epimerase/isomerase [Chitinophaga arvensicola]|uniref:Cellobiose 2-epimerase n=1 Tax=Chitinophaga arvensicola TaxID=29529 RepID=A0A1I0SBJ5_9BACT|nr:AGE family epimerase/isomerase [Chitinophaga arvensicola]SEW54035.1 mannobiose 2-epimerase [Chitinophaga arvensicola]
MQAELKASLEKELAAILDYWTTYTPDETNGGFYGKVDNDNQPTSTAPKGAVLNARILWTFSAAFNSTGKKEYLAIADRAYQYFERHFIDEVYGGVYWTVDYTGQPAETKKQVYAIAFALYAYSEYYKATAHPVVQSRSVALYNSIEQHSFDPLHGGYFEAFTREWKEIADLRLSEKDANEKKTMNTHLHIVEAYANLYTIWPDVQLRQQIQRLLQLFYDKIIDLKSGHLHLFFDEQWEIKSNEVSYGHDIEASWLLQEAAEIIADPALIEQYKALALLVTHVTLKEGIDKDGGLWYEYNNTLIEEKHWWPQAEALVGFINAWQLQPESDYLQHAYNTWRFIDRHIKDKVHGEWYWGIYKNNRIIPEDKAGLWKCPYHNARACMEGVRRLSAAG